MVGILKFYQEWLMLWDKIAQPFREKEDDLEDADPYPHLEPVENVLTFKTKIPVGFLDNAPHGFTLSDLEKYTSPYDWSHKKKSLTSLLLCTLTTATAYTAGSYNSPASRMISLWGVSDIHILLGITIFAIGFAGAPLFLAPLSELRGRRPVLIPTGVLWTISQIACAATSSYGLMLAARFLTGVGGSTFSAMGAGVLSDIYTIEDIAIPMAIFSGAALFGTGLGPLVSGSVAEHHPWRWVFIIPSIATGLLVILTWKFADETRGSVILSQKAKELNMWAEANEKQGRPYRRKLEDGVATQEEKLRWKEEFDDERKKIKKMMRVSIRRPFQFLFTEPVVFWFSLWIAFAWAILYFTFSAIPLVFSSTYHFDVEENGCVFAAICAGASVATIFQVSFEKYKRRWPFDPVPETRLYLTSYQTWLLPIGLFWFGWTARSSIHWIVPTLGIGCFSMGIFSIYLAVFQYLTETYGDYSSSALAAQSFARTILGGVFPLFTRSLFEKIGSHHALTIFGIIAAILSFVPLVLRIYGPAIRARSKYASGGDRSASAPRQDNINGVSTTAADA